MSIKHILIIICGLCLLLHSASSFAVDRTIKRNTDDGQRRIALVIGNADYKAGRLKNPGNDSRDMAKALKQSGFQVELLNNGDKRQMEDAIRSFGKRLRDGGVGLFYFAGHGIQYQGSNYLIPVGARIEDESDVRYEAVDAGRVLGKMEVADNDVNIVILDACRNNPFARSFRSAEQGLARMGAPTGSLVAYATAPGSVAADGQRGANGVYTKYLLKYISQPDLPINQLFMKVRKAVLQETGNKQTPWESSSLTGDFYFRGGGSMQVDVPEPDPQASLSTGSLVVKTDPSGAKVWVDDGYEGRSPVTIDSMLPGLVTVRAGKSGYQGGIEKVRIRSGRRSELTLLLGEEAEFAGRLFIEPTPADALVRILNIGPRYSEGMELAAGSYTVEVSKQGYGTDTRTVELAAGEDMQVAVVLEKQQPKGPKAGDTWTEPSTGMEFVYIPGGCFQMGSPSYEDGRDEDDEGPQHEVCVDGFWLGRYEVTNRQYRLFRSGHNSKEYKNKSFNGNDQPAVYVSWDEAKDFSSWLGRKSGKDIGLPSEAQWEYAARAGTTTSRFWGDSPDSACRYANVHDRTSKRVLEFSWEHHNCDDGYAVTAPVGSFQANAFGLYDMLGNVWEWCSDWYGDNYYSSSPRTNPRGPSSGSYRVLRGGGWNDGPWYVRSANRDWRTPGSRGGILGFRLVFPEGSR